MTTASPNFLSRMSRGGDAGALSPLRASPRRTASRNSNDYDLSELSPRPSSPLLSPDHENESGLSEDTRSRWRDSKSRKGKGKAVAYAEPLQQWPPVSVMDRMRNQRQARQASRDETRQGPRRGTRSHNLPSWTPPLPSEYHGHGEDEYHHDGQYRKNEVSAQNQGGYASGMSIMGSMLLGRSSSGTDSQPVVEVDSTFRNIRRREKQLQNELQKLLDAQGAALERQISGDAPGSDNASTTPSRRSSASQSPRRTRIDMYDRSTPLPAVMPVRQPKPKRLSLRQVRNSIARAMSMLADLKEEESQCILEAREARVAAIAKANRLSSQHKAIASDLRALESDKDDPLRRQMESMQDEYKQVCGDIEELEQKLRLLKRTKGQLEQKMEEVRSERESGMSGYRGALKETERGIGEMMKRPGVRVLELDGDMAAEADATVPEGDAAGDDGDDEEAQTNKTKQAYMQRRLTGQEFMRLRPERRTLAMAKEWWEGEIALLARRQTAVDHELAALHEGMEVWADVTGQIQDYEARLTGALGSLPPSTPGEKDNRSSERMLRNQYRDLKSTIARLEDRLRLAESKGWNLLLAAIGAELTGFVEGERVLQQIMHSQGVVDFEAVASESEKPVTNGLVDVGGGNKTPPTTTGPRAEGDRDDDEDEGKKRQKARPGTEELTGSVIRLWGEPDLPSQSSPPPRSPVLSSSLSPARSSSPSPAPSPPAPSPPTRTSRTATAAADDDVEESHDDDDDGSPKAAAAAVAQGPPLHEESSDNEVPFGLLSERPGPADESEDEHANEVPPEFLSIHAETAAAAPARRADRAGDEVD